MPSYTTGELAKLCGVTVRTVQYYDTRGVLTPSALSEGGRRLYSEEDPGSVIQLLLEQQEAALRQEIDQRQSRLALLHGLRRNLQELESVSVDSIGDVARILERKDRLRRTRFLLLATAIPCGIMEWSAIFLWLLQGVWWPLALYTLLLIPYVLWTLRFYRRQVSYICPRCHRVFKPGKRELFFAKHTLVTRKLTCPGCGHRGFCIETDGEEEEHASGLHPV